MTSESIAVQNCILLGVAGSELYGTAVESGDRDYMGLCLEPPSYVIGLEHFEQWQHHSAGEHVRSTGDDIDVTIYSFRKWMRLAAQGNPTVLLLGFTPPDKLLVDVNYFMSYLQDHMHLFWTKQAIARFLGYLSSQRDQMLGLTGRRHSNRPELVDAHGFDTKFAYHAVRLGMQGVEFMQHQRITLPMPPKSRRLCLDIRAGKHTKNEVVQIIDWYANQLRSFDNDDRIPDAPDMAQINKWLTREYASWWQQSGYPNPRRALMFRDLVTASNSGG